MKLRTLECFCEVATNGFNLSRAAKALHATQPAVTRQIQLLEQEIGFPVFERSGNRALRLTAAGRVTYERAQKIVNEVREFRLIKEDLLEDAGGALIIATTEFNARYTLLPAIKRYRSEHPNVTFSIVSVDPSTAAQMVIAGDADLGVCTATPEAIDKLLSYKCFEIDRVLVVPRSHPLTRVKHITLKHIAAYPLVIYDSRLSGNRKILDVFEEQGIEVRIALSAMTADVIKSYVAAGIGIGIIQKSAFDRKRDDEISALDIRSLFKPTPVFLLLRRDSTPRAILRQFISVLAPKFDLLEVKII